MRPSTLRLVAGGIAIGGVIGAMATATARADVAPVVIDYAVEHGSEICGDLMFTPSVPGVVGSVVDIEQRGFPEVEARQIVWLSIGAICPQYMNAWVRFVDLDKQGNGALTNG